MNGGIAPAASPAPGRTAPARDAAAAAPVARDASAAALPMAVARPVRSGPGSMDGVRDESRFAEFMEGQMPATPATVAGPAEDPPAPPSGPPAAVELLALLDGQWRLAMAPPPSTPAPAVPGGAGADSASPARASPSATTPPPAPGVPAGAAPPAIAQSPAPPSPRGAAAAAGPLPAAASAEAVFPLPVRGQTAQHIRADGLLTGPAAGVDAALPSPARGAAAAPVDAFADARPASAQSRPAPQPPTEPALAAFAAGVAATQPVDEAAAADPGIATVAESAPSGFATPTPVPAAAVRAQATPGMPLPMPADPQAGFDDGFGTQVAWIAEQRLGHAEIRLNPEHVGTIDVRIQLDGDRVDAQFHSPNAEVRQALEASLPRLRELLGQHGLQLGQADVGQGQARRDPGAPEGGADADDGAGALPARSAPLRPRALLDAYA